MKKNVVIACLFIAFHSVAISQSLADGQRMDSLRMDSLKKKLPLLKDSALVDAMNRISIESIYFYMDSGFKQRRDSVHYYAAKAYDDAKRIGYKLGMAMAQLNMSKILGAQSFPVKDEATKEKNIREAIRLAEEINNNEVLG